MIFDFVYATDSQSLSRLSFKAFVDEVGCFFWVALWKFFLLDVGLFLPDSISDCLSIFTTIRSLAHHTFVPNYSHSKVINSMTVILFEHYFGSHVSWCPTILLTVFRLPFLSYTKISEAQVPTGIKHKILRFDISVNDTLLMYRFECLDETCQEELGTFVRKLSYMQMVVPQVTTFHKIHHQEQVVLISKSPGDVHDEFTFNLLH